MLHIDLVNIDNKVVNFSQQAFEGCQQLAADTNSGAVKAIEAYIPASMTVIEGAKEILTVGAAALKALHDLADDEGFKGRLLTLSGQLTNLETAGQHEWGNLITWIQTVYNHWKKKKGNVPA